MLVISNVMDPIIVKPSSNNNHLDKSFLEEKKYQKNILKKNIFGNILGPFSILPFPENNFLIRFFESLILIKDLINDYILLMMKGKLKRINITVFATLHKKLF